MATLVGRDAELSRLGEWLGAGVPVVAIWGPAGVGKSRLAREAAPAAPVATLVACRDEDDVLRTVGAALGLSEVSAPAVARAVSKTPRLVLDACDPVEAVLAPLLAGWERAQILVTSRGRATVEGAEHLELSPLAEEDAIALWAEACAALRHAPSPELAREVVTSLDRLPQAIEWLAGRAALLGDAACLARLKSRTMEAPLAAALAESLLALDPVAREALSLLAAFDDGAPAAVLDPLVSLDSLDALTARSLVHLERRADAPTRVRPYRAVTHAMRERAEAEGTWPRLRRAHADAVLSHVEATPGAARAERAELAAIASRFAAEDATVAARALVLLAPVAMTDGSMDEVAARLDALGAPEDETLRSRVALARARIERRRGAFDAARDHLARVAEPMVLEAMLERAHLDRQQSRSEEALRGYEAALAKARSDGDHEAESVCLGEVGRMLQSAGRLRDAREHHARAIALDKKLGLGGREALERSLHARATHRLGEVREAIALHERALAMHRVRGDERLAAAELGHLGFCHHELGAHEEAERSYRASIEGLAKAGDVALEQIERVLLARLLADVSRFEEARLELHIARELAHDLDMPRAWLTWQLVAGLVEHLAGDAESARRIWAAGVGDEVLLEVGFEVLLPAHMALVGDVREALLSRAEAALTRLENPGTVLAFRTLSAAATGGELPEAPEALLSVSSDARRARRLAGHEVATRTLIIASDGSFFRVGEETADLRRRSAPRRLMIALADAHAAERGAAVSRERLIDAGWPGERMRADAADKRLRTAIWTLRKAGLEGILLTRDDGYLLDPLISVVRAEEPLTGA